MSANFFSISALTIRSKDSEFASNYVIGIVKILTNGSAMLLPEGFRKLTFTYQKRSYDDEMDETVIFWTTYGSKFYDFPCCLLLGDGNITNSWIRLLRWQQCNLVPEYTNFLGFNTLTSLDLRWVNLKPDEHFQNILANCHVLEWLSLHRCYHLYRLNSKDSASDM